MNLNSIARHQSAVQAVADLAMYCRSLFFTQVDHSLKTALIAIATAIAIASIVGELTTFMLSILVEVDVAQVHLSVIRRLRKNDIVATVFGIDIAWSLWTEALTLGVLRQCFALFSDHFIRDNLVTCSMFAMCALLVCGAMSFVFFTIFVCICRCGYQTCCKQNPCVFHCISPSNFH